MSLKMHHLAGLCLCAAGAALGAENVVVQQPFATAVTGVTALTGDKAGTWAGYGSVTNQPVAETAGYSYTASVGRPINSATDKLYLSVDGYVTCTAATTANKPATVDMMIQIAKPEDELTIPSGETTSDIQIAVGVQNDGTLKVYCKNKSGTVAWYSLGDTVYTEGSWHRVSFTFDYANGTCQVRLDGEPLMTANGYLTSAKTGGNGSWYTLNATGTNLSSVKVVGSTAIDEVVVKDGDSVTEALPVLADATGATDGGVPYSWIEQQGITRAQADGNAPDNSGMTVAAKYKTGLTVADGRTYAITAMSMAGGTGAVKATLTIPAMNPPSGRKNVIVYGTSASDLNQTQDLSANQTSVELSVTPAESGVTKIYYQLKNVAQ